MYKTFPTHKLNTVNGSSPFTAARSDNMCTFPPAQYRSSHYIPIVIHPGDEEENGGNNKRDSWSGRESPDPTEEKTNMNPEIYEAAAKGDVVHFESLVVEMQDIENLPSPDKSTVLHVAANFGHVTLVQSLLQRYPILLRKKNSYGDTSLHVAARGGHFSIVTLLTKSNEDVKLQQKLMKKENNRGDLAMHEAARNRHEKVLQFLVECCPNLSYQRNKNGDSPAFMAAEAGFVEIVKQIFTSSTFTMDEQHCRTPLHGAILGTQAEVVEIIVEKAPDIINIADHSGKTPLHYAALLGFSKVIPYLVKRDTSCVYKRDDDGFFPIHLASSKGHIDIIQDLLKCSQYSGELLNKEEQNILHVAAMNGRANVINLVLNTQGLEKLINRRDKYGNTALHLASKFMHPKIVSILTRDKRVEKSIINDDRMTAMDVADNIDTSAWFQKILTIAALKVARAPRAHHRYTLKANFKQKDTNDSSMVENFKDRINTLLVVATLIIAMAFTAGITMPGGYHSDNENKGMAILLKKTLFHTFVICNTLALYSSFIVAVTLIWAQLGVANLSMFALKFVLPLLGLSLTMVSIAFTTAVSLVVSKLNWLSTTILIMGLIFLLCSLALFIPLCLPYDSKSRFLWYVSYLNFSLLIYATRSDDDDDGDKERHIRYRHSDKEV